MIILTVIIIVFLFMGMMWLWYRWTNNPSVVDVGWGIGISISGCLFLVHDAFSQRILLITFLLLLWGVRLSGYLWYTRIRVGEIDKRYIQLSESWFFSKKVGFFINFQLQGLFILLLTTPFYFISNASVLNVSLIDCLLSMLLIIALIAESIADYQLYKFKKTMNKQVFSQGLWKYSRHPNYFFEWVIWCIFGIFAFTSPYGWIALISPLTLYLIMTRITIPLTEQGSIVSKGKDYLNYQEKTPPFFPVHRPSID